MSTPPFSDAYFAFLLSGKAEDFQQATEAFHLALTEGVPIEQLQFSMDESHSSAELLCLVLDTVPTEKPD